MSIKLCLLKTGETVIGDVKEVIDPNENKTLGFKIFAPYVVNYEYEKTINTEQLENVDNIKSSLTQDSQINFKFWAPLSSDRDFNFPHEFVEVIYEPHNTIVQSYLSILEHWQKENTLNVTVDTDQTIITMNTKQTPDNLIESSEIEVIDNEIK